MKKKLFSVLLCLTMVMGLLPQATVQAAETEHKHCVCGAKHQAIGDHTAEAETEFTAWTSTDSLPNTAGNYYLTDNVSISNTWQPANGTVLCLNGKTIACTGDTKTAVFVGTGVSFTLTDCGTTGKLTHAEGIGGHALYNGGRFTMYDGSISDNNGRSTGGGVDNAGAFIMYGGSILNNNSNGFFGGGVFNGNQSTFVMYDGTISGNKGYDGAGVYNGGSMTVYGNANITGNKKKSDESASNVYLADAKTITIDGSFGGKMGVKVDKLPSAGSSVSVATGAAADKDYSANIISDNSAYKIVHDSSDKTKLVLVSKNAVDPDPEETEHKHYLCGAKHQEIGDHTEDAETTFTAWTSADSLPNTAGSYYLDTDVTLTSAIEYKGNISTAYCGWDVPDGVVLCLNGHTISMKNPEDVTKKDVDVIKVTGHFTLTDCKDNKGSITHAKNASDSTYSGKGVKVLGGTFDMYGGTITGNTSAYDTGGSGVCVQGVSDTTKSSLFNLYGGAISGNIAKSGGGVDVTRVVWYGPSEFRMYGGSITDNVADSTTASYGTGGGVYVSWTAKFVMNGGTISGNTATQFGGGVYASALAANNAYDYGGAAALEVSGTASITGNKVEGKENNLCLDSSASNYQTVSSKLALTGALSGTIGVNVTTAPTAEAPVTIATGAANGTDYSKNIVSDDTRYQIQKEGTTLLLTTDGYTHVHTWGEWQHDNDRHWRVCEACAQESEREEHKWDNGVITKEPTTAAAGEKTFTCEVCKATRVESIDQLSPEPSVTYEILEGANGSWAQNSDGVLTFRANGDLSKFEGVKVDGDTISADHYTAASGSTVVTLKKDYLATLSVGKHELTIVYNDGECSTEFEIKADASDKKPTVDPPANGSANKPADKTNKANQTAKSGKKAVPKTGDMNNLALWMALLILGGVMMGTTVVSKKKKYNR